ncbi:MAG: GYD domain-containing protein [Deltaproteobacteria bacterium]|nr:GYD domain-containing protein [Deltaproteobacteria bacterium]
MATFFMFGRYSSTALEKISPERTTKVIDTLRSLGGEVKAIYALFGEHDLVLIVDFSQMEQAMKASVAITKMTGISFTTSQAVSVEDFDKMMTEL